MKISNSSTKVYKDCGLKYKYSYKDRLRPKSTGSALIFGSALDKALNKLLISKDLAEAEKEFRTAMLNIEYNKKNIHVPTSELITYYKSDFDVDLLTEEDYAKFNAMAATVNYAVNAKELPAFLEYLHDLKKKRKELNKAEQTLFALANYMSLVRKGILILKAYNDKIMPQIKEVISIQEEIELTNNEGDSIIGYIDAVLRMKDDFVYIMDNKTTSDFKYYPEDSAKNSQQLVLYKHATQHKYGAKGVGYIILLKKLKKIYTKICSKCGEDGSAGKHTTCNVGKGKKRCGGTWNTTLKFDVETSILLNDTDDDIEDSIIQMYDDTVQAIKQEIFEPNWNSCGAPGSPIACPYRKLCHNNDDSDLEIV
jgi:PD-(D/E)XK nuclease superfamily